MSENRCITCGAIIPEGRQICPVCESGRRDTGRTKFLLRQYRDMEWKARNAEQIIRECNDMMTSLGGMSSGARVQGGGNTRESLLVSCIERKARCEAAVNFIDIQFPHRPSGDRMGVSELSSREVTSIRDMRQSSCTSGLTAILKTEKERKILLTESYR